MANKIEQMATECALLRLAKHQPAVVDGINQIFRDQIIYKPLEHAAKVLLNAKNENQLRSVEASMQVMIKEIQKQTVNPTLHLGPQKIALYLYTLQNLILNLGSWELKGGRTNQYIPVLEQKYLAVMDKAVAQEITPETVQQKCHNDQYQVQDAEHPELGTFTLLDEDLIEQTAAEIDQQALKKKTLAIDAPRSSLKEPDVKILDKVINILKRRIGHNHLTVAYIVNNLDYFFAQVGRVMRIDNQQQISRVTEAIMQRILTVKETVGRGIQRLGTAATAVLDKVTSAVKEQLGALALSVHYFLGNIETVFQTVGAALHTHDKSVLAQVTEAMMQRQVMTTQTNILNSFEPVR